MIRYVFALLLCMGTVYISAQPCGSLRYQQRVFGQSFKTSNVVFANAPSLPPTVYLGENVTQNVTLTLDVFEPFGDTLQKRPLVILAFGGAFLIGSKDDEDMQTIADSLARRGYVTASINYRLGMNVADAASAERAIYRATQDFSAAVRFFKEKAAYYRIDTNYIYAGGVSAGGFAAMHMALVDEADRPASTFAAGGLTPRPDLGCKDCAGNAYAHSSNVRGLINYWGAIGNLNWIKPSNAKPLVSFHGEQDLIVPFNTGYPFTALALLPQVSGSAAIKQRYDQIGAYNNFTAFPNVGHNVWGLIVTNQFTPGPNQYFLPIYNGTASFLYQQTRPEKPVIAGADSVCPGEFIYTVPIAAGLRYCWDVDGGQIVSQTGNQVRVRWQTPGLGQLRANAINHLDALSATDTFYVWVNAPVVASIIAPEGTVVCSGSPLPMFATSVAAQYNWLPANFYADASADSTVLYPLISGLYYLNTTDTNGCLGRDSLYINVLPPPLPPVVSQSGDTLWASTTSGTVNWYSADSSLVGSGEYFVPSTTGIYYAQETALNGCGSWSIPFDYLATGIAFVNSAVKLYPNPFIDDIIVELPSGGVFTLYNVRGGQVAQFPLTSFNRLALGFANSGLYFYTLITPQGTLSGKLVKY